MAIEAHSGRSSATPRRAITACVGLFAMSAALAGAMTWSRSANRLGEPVKPADWDVSFRAPKGFHHGQVLPTQLGPACVFRALTRPGRPVLVIRRIHSELAGTAYELGLRLLGGEAQRPDAMLRVLGEQATPLRTQLGVLPALELRDAKNETVVRTAIAGGGQGYAVVLSVDGVPIDAALYGMFERTCASFEFDFD